MFNLSILQLINGTWKPVTTVSAFTVGMLTLSAAGYVKLALASGIPVRITATK